MTGQKKCIIEEFTHKRYNSMYRTLLRIFHYQENVEHWTFLQWSILLYK